MNIRSIGIAFMALFAIAGCSGNESAAKKAVTANLKDPDSARFGKFTEFGTNTACLSVNAKNSMGGYTGEQQALLVELKQGWVVLNISNESHEQCISFASTANMKKVIDQFRSTTAKE
jgi:hypothetical protein